MPDSKLVEKLGFTLVSSEKYPGLYDIVKDGYENQGATTEEIALWKLCLELSAELDAVKAWNERLARWVDQSGDKNEELQGICKGLMDVVEGKTKSLSEVQRECREKFGKEFEAEKEKKA